MGIIKALVKLALPKKKSKASTSYTASRSSSTQTKAATKSGSGVIGYYKMSGFWKSLSSAEQSSIAKHSSVVGRDNMTSGHFESTQTALGFITSQLTWAKSEHKNTLAKKLIEYGYKIEHDGTLVDRHFFYQDAAAFFYSIDKFSDAAKCCLDDIRIFPMYAAPLKRECGGELPNIDTFKRLAMSYEKQGEYDLAIGICKQAISHGLSDGTKGNYAGRIERLEKAKAKAAAPKKTTKKKEAKPE